VTRVLVNGRFLGQRTTGAQRYARELLKAMDLLLGERNGQPFSSFTVLTPPSTPRSLPLTAMAIREVGKFQGHLWEQVELAAHSRNDLLLNLCNTAPLTGRRMIATILDASVYAVPEAYSLPFRTWYRTLIPVLGRRARRVVTISEFSRTELQRYAGIPSARIAVIPASGEHILGMPADRSVLDRLRLRSNGYLLAVSSHSRHKNIAGVARAAALLTGGNFEVVLAGGGNSRVFSGTAAAGDGPLRCTGYVSDAELRALYEHAACFVYPSFYEGFGLPPLEAMTCGCPVVVSRVASLPEVCGDAALYCDPADPRDIARAVSEVVTDRALQDDLRRRGTERAASFSWRRSAQALLDIVDSMVIH
jgi:glycosyltransferase involved in cell wall biosynthesis